MIVAGIYFLAREYIPWLELNRVWPIALVGLGVLLLIRALDIGDRGSPPTSPPNP